MLKISFLPLLVLEIPTNKTLNIRLYIWIWILEDDLKKILTFFLHKPFISVKNRLHAKNHLPTFVVSGDSYEEDH